MAATNKTAAPRAIQSRPPKRAANGGRSNGHGPPVLVLTSAVDEGEENRIALFSIDGEMYSIPDPVPGYVSLETTHLWANEGEARATDWLMGELLGDDGYAALRGCKTITKAQIQQVMKICVERTMGDGEDPKDS